MGILGNLGCAFHPNSFPTLSSAVENFSYLLLQYFECFLLCFGRRGPLIQILVPIFFYNVLFESPRRSRRVFSVSSFLSPSRGTLLDVSIKLVGCRYYQNYFSLSRYVCQLVRSIVGINI